MNFKKRLQKVHHPGAERPACRVFVANKSTNRKVLIVADESAINNLLALMRRLESRRVVAGNSKIDLLTLNRRSFDTAILDLRCSQGRPGGRGYGIGEVWPNMVGKVLVINAEVNDQKTFQSVERYIYHRYNIDGLRFEVTRFLRAIFGHSPSPNEI